MICSNDAGLHLADTEELADVIALVRLEEAVDAHLLQVALAKVAGGVTCVELRVGPYVSHALRT